MRFFLVIAFCCLITYASSAALTDMKPCLIQRTLVTQYGNPNDFIPICDDNGDYAYMQCREGFCWCAAKDGTQLTKSKPSIPDCSGQPR